jgi:hypothetical protein
VTDLGWKCTDCWYEDAPRETRTCPRCNGKMDTAEEREAVARKAALADSVEEVCRCGAFFSTVNTITGQPHCDGPERHPLPRHESNPSNKRERLAEVLSTESKNFIGTELTMSDRGGRGGGATPFKAGDRVRITEGEHADRTGTVIKSPWGELALRVDAEAGLTRPGPGGVARGGRGGFVCDISKYNLVPL